MHNNRLFHRYVPFVLMASPSFGGGGGSCGTRDYHRQEVSRLLRENLERKFVPPGRMAHPVSVGTPLETSGYK